MPSTPASSSCSYRLVLKHTKPGILSLGRGFIPRHPENYPLRIERIPGILTQTTRLVAITETVPKHYRFVMSLRPRSRKDIVMITKKVEKTMLHSIWRQIIWICALAALSTSLYAADGEVLISQDHALAGNVTPGDAPGFPVTLSLPGSYRLAGNLTVPDANTTAIQITADDVTLDLNGFRIAGPVVCNPQPTTCTTSGTGAGVQSITSGTVAPRGVKLLNGTIRGMGFVGVLLLGDNSVVERVNASGNAGPGIVVGSDGTVTDSVASVNMLAGIVGAAVRNSTADKNSGIGILIRFDGVATSNRANGNGTSGIVALNSSTLTGNTANNNQNFGIEAACPGSVVGNTTAANQAGGINTNGVCTLANNAQ
jgi:hypothetical protein